MTLRWPRTGLGALLFAAVLAASCATAGMPVAERTTPSSTMASTSATSAAAAPGTAVSDEDQVRATVAAFQDAANTQNWDAYLQLMCPSMRERFTGPVLDMVKKSRAESGMTRATVTSVTIEGDTATATLDSQNEIQGSATVTLPLVRGDGWKICMQY